MKTSELASNSKCSLWPYAPHQCSARCRASSSKIPKAVNLPLVIGGWTSPNGEFGLTFDEEAAAADEEAAAEGGVGETAIGAHLCRFGDL